MLCERLPEKPLSSNLAAYYIVTNRYDITNNGEDRREKQNTKIIMRNSI